MDNDTLLKNHIISLSKAKVFSEAKKEWSLIDVEYSYVLESCPCGQKIKEKCYIQNKFTNEITFVGNVCIKKFLGVDTGKTFYGLKQILNDIYKHPNGDLIQWAYKLGYIDEREKVFLQSIKNKKGLSDRQLKWLKDINERIIKHRKKHKKTIL